MSASPDNTAEGTTERTTESTTERTTESSAAGNTRNKGASGIYYAAVPVIIFWLVFTVITWVSPSTDISGTERRKLAQFPKFNTDTVLKGSFMSNFEKYAQDQIPFRDDFRTLKAVFHNYVLFQKDNNDIYIADGYAAKLEYPLNEELVVRAYDKISGICDRYLGESEGKIYLTVVPDKGYFLAEKNGYPALDYQKLFDIMAASDKYSYIDIKDTLSVESYYKTDTHWKQEEIFETAGVIATAMGNKAPDKEEYTAEALERDFYGVYYGQAALPLSPEKITVMKNPVLSECVVTNAENTRVTEVYDMEKLTSRDLYDVYLSGSVSLEFIDNPSGIPGKELIVFRDSFGSSLVPLLVGDYSKITLVDIRYLDSGKLSEFIDFHGQDVLFMYSTLIINRSTILK